MKQETGDWGRSQESGDQRGVASNFFAGASAVVKTEDCKMQIENCKLKILGPVRGVGSTRGRRVARQFAIFNSQLSISNPADPTQLLPSQGQRNLTCLQRVLNFKSSRAWKLEAGNRRGRATADCGLRTVDCGLAVILVWLACAGTVAAQAPGAAAPDPFIALQMSQPRIELSVPTNVVARFDPPVVRLGEVSVYRVIINALEPSIEWPDKLRTPPQLELRPSAHGQALEPVSGHLEPRTTFIYRVRASSLGQFSMPQFTVNVYGQVVTVPAAQLEVVAAPAEGAPPAPQLTLEVPVANVFVGQAVTVRVQLPPAPNGMVQPLLQPQLSGEGFLVDPNAVRPRLRPGVPAYTYEILLTPIAAGKLGFFAQGFMPGMPLPPLPGSDAAGAPGVPLQFTLLDSEPAELEVKPLPPEGRLPGFTGAVGRFTLEPPKLATNVLRVGDPVQLTVTVRGEGHLGHLVAPRPPLTQDWQVFAPSTEAGPAPAFALPGQARFTYTLIALSVDARATPAIPFSYFDPQRGRYADLTIPPVPVTASAGPAPGDVQALRQPDAATVALEKEPVLQDLAAFPGWRAASLTPVQQRAWFPLVQLAPATLFLGLWIRERRCRYREQHPDLVLRRRARRALRRQWRALRRAARAGDAAGFAAAAVSALRVACAPHYPAEPRALVGGDVLSLLPEQDRCGRAGAVARRFFAVTDAARFANVSADATDLLALQPELEHLLEALEEKL